MEGCITESGNSTPWGIVSTNDMLKYEKYICIYKLNYTFFIFYFYSKHSM